MHYNLHWAKVRHPRQSSSNTTQQQGSTTAHSTSTTVKDPASAYNDQPRLNWNTKKLLKDLSALMTASCHLGKCSEVLQVTLVPHRFMSLSPCRSHGPGMESNRSKEPLLSHTASDCSWHLPAHWQQPRCSLCWLGYRFLCATSLVAASKRSRLSRVLPIHAWSIPVIRCFAFES
jgi:hypothetical protein